jgi:hypothetical protein
MKRKQALIELRDKVKAETYATMGHTILCQRAFPKPDDFDGSSEAYAKSEAQMAILAWRNDDLNAAKALHEAVLPFGYDNFDVFSLSGEVVIKRYKPINRFYGFADCNPARAWLLAILEALISQEATT